MGGSAREWGAVLPADLEAGGAVGLRLVMTKFEGDAARIAYEVRLEMP